MAVVEAQRRVNAQSEMIWNIVADLTGEAGKPPMARGVEWLSGEGLGLRRRINAPDAVSWEEECVVWEPPRMYTMRVKPEGFPIPCAYLRYTCSLSVESGAVLVRLYFDYAPRFGLIGALLDRFGNRQRLYQHATQMLDNWIRMVHAREWAYRITVRRIIEEKGGHVHVVSPETRVAEVAAVLAENRIGSALVLDAEGVIVGVLSERDIVRGLATAGESLLTQPASQIMTREVILARPEDNMMSVMACMSERRIRHLPVVDGDNVLGLISIGDVIKARISELEGESETLLEYIEARRWHELYKELGPAAYTDTVLR